MWNNRTPLPIINFAVCYNAPKHDLIQILFYFLKRETTSQLTIFYTFINFFTLFKSSSK